MKKLTFIILISIIVSSCVKQSNWNQYLGPDRNAVSKEVGIMRSWPEEGPEKLWEVKLGPGYGGASIFGDEVFVLDRVDEKWDILRCLDLSTGKKNGILNTMLKGKYLTRDHASFLS